MTAEPLPAQLEATACPVRDAQGRQCSLTTRDHAAGATMHLALVGEALAGRPITAGFGYIWRVDPDPQQLSLVVDAGALP